MHGQQNVKIWLDRWLSEGWKQRFRSRGLGVLRLFLTFIIFHWKVDVLSCWPVFMSVYTSLLYQMHVRTSGTLVHNFLQNQEVFPYQISLRYRMCFLKIAAWKLVEVFTGVSSRVHAIQHSLRCERITKMVSGVFTDLLRRFHPSALKTTQFLL